MGRSQVMSHDLLHVSQLTTQLLNDVVVRLGQRSNAVHVVDETAWVQLYSFMVSTVWGKIGDCGEVAFDKSTAGTFTPFVKCELIHSCLL